MAPKLNPRRGSSQVNIENEDATNEGEVETVKAKWDDWNTEIFLTICVEEIRDVGQETGLGWDHEKKTVLASESWWTDKININPEFAKFKNEGPKSLDRLEQCFKDIVATGYSAWAPSEDPNPEEFNQNNEGFESGGDMNYTNEFIEEDIANYTVVQSPTREKRRKTSNKKVEKRAGIASRLQDSLDRILVGVESKAATKGDDPYSIENCIKLLRKLPGLEPYSPQFYLGIRLMAKPQYRETFIALSDDPNQQLGWLESFKLDDMNRL
ncbi:hypothetical protein HN51_053370 [Arachis hypogaea]|uniref:uncharacterized protein LOC107614656 n=1 Tax=Arachis ipaensis TaxID=130454 RepID=UPI0007AF92D0|nr:uncharacterized protein LOC107614656 [Arachis ipaensis]